MDELDAAEAAARAQAAPSPRSSVPARKSATEAADAAQAATAPVSTEAKAAIEQLAQLAADATPLSAERAGVLKQQLAKLVAAGPGAVQPIREFLAQNTDVSLDEVKGGATVGYASLRTGLFDALHQIGGPEARGALEEVLRTTGDPAEIGLLARHLDDLAPGELREQFVTAAKETLAQLSQSEARSDVGPLFQVLQTYGGPDVVPELQKAASQWQYYAMMALAGLPGGEGLNALIQQTQQGGDGTVKNTFALQMLAQAAAEHPAAGAALLEQAKAGQVPERAWRRIADALAGDQYQFARDPKSDVAAMMRTPGVKTYHIGSTDENFYSVPLGPNAPDEQLERRRDLVDALLKSTRDPAAVDALNKAKNQLTASARP